MNVKARVANRRDIKRRMIIICVVGKLLKVHGFAMFGCINKRSGRSSAAVVAEYNDVKKIKLVCVPLRAYPRLCLTRVCMVSSCSVWK